MAKDKFKDIHAERNAVSSFFQAKWDEAEENKRFARMLQYSGSQLAKFDASNRVPYVLDFITQPINTYIGDQRDSRTDIKYLPQDASDEVRAELLNAVKDVILRRNRWMWLESDIFMDGIVEKAGAVGYEWSTEKNALGSLNMFRVPIRQLTWDINRREFDLEVSSWVSRTRLYNKRQLMAKYPDHADEINEMTFDGSNLDDLKLDESYFKTIIDTDLSAVALIEFYERKYKNKFIVTRERGGEPFPQNFDSEKAAQEFITQQKELEIRQLFEQQQQAQASGQPFQMPPESSWNIIKRFLPVVLKSEVASGMDLVSEEEQAAPFYPYDVYYPFWEDGEYWSVMDMYKDPQRFINKMFSMVDHQIATGSKGLLVLADSIPEEKRKQIVEKWGTTGGAFTVPDPKNDIVHIPPASFDSKLLDIMQAAMANIEKKAGGANFLGRQETSGESGVAIRSRTQRASVASFMIYDNLDRFKLSVGEKIAWYISNLMTAQQKIRVEGDQLTQFAQKNFPGWLYTRSEMNPQMGFMEINGAPGTTLDDLKVDIIVDQSAHAATKNKEVLSMIQQMIQASPMLAETIPPQLLISLFDLPASEKQKMMQGAEQLMQARMEQQKAEANKPPTLSANMKDVTLLDTPELQAQFLQKFGLDKREGNIISDPATDFSKQKELVKQMGSMEDRQFKQEKHHDQIGLKMAGMLDQNKIENQKLALQKEKDKKDAIQKSQAPGSQGSN